MICGRVLNMSASGALVEALKPIAVGSQVRIHANELLTGIESDWNSRRLCNNAIDGRVRDLSIAIDETWMVPQ